MRQIVAILMCLIMALGTIMAPSALAADSSGSACRNAAETAVRTLGEDGGDVPTDDLVEAIHTIAEKCAIGDYVDSEIDDAMDEATELVRLEQVSGGTIERTPCGGGLNTVNGYFRGIKILNTVFRPVQTSGSASVSVNTIDHSDTPFDGTIGGHSNFDSWGVRYYAGQPFSTWALAGVKMAEGPIPVLDCTRVPIYSDLATRVTVNHHSSFLGLEDGIMEASLYAQMCAPIPC